MAFIFIFSSFTSLSISTIHLIPCIYPFTSCLSILLYLSVVVIHQPMLPFPPDYISVPPKPLPHLISQIRLHFHTNSCLASSVLLPSTAYSSSFYSNFRMYRNLIPIALSCASCHGPMLLFRPRCLPFLFTVASPLSPTSPPRNHLWPKSSTPFDRK